MSDTLIVDHPEGGVLQDAVGISCGFNQLQATRRGLMVYPRFDTVVGSSYARYGEYAENDFAILSQLIKAGDQVVEIGAHVGAYTLMMAQQVGPTGAVMAWEGQRILFQALCANMALNGISQTHCCPWVAGETSGHLKMPFIDYYAPHAFSTYVPSVQETGETVQQVALDELQLTTCHLIRIQTGFRTLDVLRGAVDTIQRLQPILYIHWNHGESKPGLVYSLLKSWGYQLYWSLSPIFNPDNMAGIPVEEAHVVDGVMVHLMGIPSSSDWEPQGFTPITAATDDWRTIITS